MLPRTFHTLTDWGFPLSRVEWFAAAYSSCLPPLPSFSSPESARVITRRRTIVFRATYHADDDYNDDYEQDDSAPNDERCLGGGRIIGIRPSRRITILLG